MSSGAGDPLDVGLLGYASSRDLDVASLRAAHPPISQRPFDSAWKFARITVPEDSGAVSYLKGAPEVLLRRCTLTNEDRESWTEKADAYGRERFRVLALAWADGETEHSLSLTGLALFWDPPRPEVPEAVRKALSAGVRVVMVTGDHPATGPMLAFALDIATSRAPSCCRSRPRRFCGSTS
jgi:Ca2+-transporting ATPase